ncbi:unnamed protein product [Cladocopium goreaui]|uniref:Uncharacterized protein n=1 Tax=Cladocopium goreaui TaxID=2562237 RepID=A0A9P1FIX5_9DINO|nr:unnamed protein product [Cladocopium goreaui]
MQGHQESVRGTRHLSLLNQEICNRGFMRLLGLGKHRFQTIASASRAGLDKCPMDERFLPRAAKEPSVKRQAVYDFLHALWEQAGETLPDPNHTGSNKRPRQGQHRFDDKSLPRTDLRHIPPGKFMDYLRLCRLENPDLLISRKLFTSVWMVDFQNKLRIRQTGHHAKCSVCIRHRLIIKRKCHFANFLDNPHLKGIGGLTRDSLIDKFWRRRNVAQSLSDVVLRTKRFMSDAEYQPKVFLYLPACQAMKVAMAPSPPGQWFNDV